MVVPTVVIIIIIGINVRILYIEYFILGNAIQMMNVT